MLEVEQFLGDWRNTVLFFFSLVGMVYTALRIRAAIRARMDALIDEAVQAALIDQRQNYQAEAIDELLKVIGEQAEANRRYCNLVVKYSKEAAQVSLLLDKHNITVK